MLFRSAAATAGKIQQIVSPEALPEHVRLIVANAIYFKSDWATHFEQGQTRDAPFTLADGSAVGVPLMHREGSIRFLQSREFQLVDLPYKAEALSMTILLPRQPDGLGALEQKLTPESIDGWIAQAERTEVSLFLPRFKLSGTFELAGPLQELGIDRKSVV